MNVENFHKEPDVLNMLKCPACQLSGPPDEANSADKIAPQCGHTFCRFCISQATKTAPGNKKMFTCPVCRTINEIDSNNGLVTNFALESALGVISRRTGSADEGDCFGDSCTHLALINKTIECDRCSLKFCECCLFRHMERVRIETTLQANDIAKRWKSASERFSENIGSFKQSITEQVRLASDDIIRVTENIEWRILENIKATRKQMLAEVEEFGRWQIGKIEQLREKLAKKDDATKDVREISDVSLLYLSPSDVQKTYKKVSEFDKLLFEIEDALENGITSILPKVEFIPEIDYLTNARCVKIEPGSIVYTDPSFDFDNVLTISKKLHEFAINGDISGIEGVLTDLPASCVEYLLYHFDPNDEGKTILHQAAEHGHIELIQHLVTEFGVNVRASCYDDNSRPIHLAVASGHLEIVKFLCALDPENCALNDFCDQKPLHIAAMKGDLEIARFLLKEMKVEVDQLDCVNRTPLMLASEAGHLEFVNFLIEMEGACLTLKPKHGYSPMHYAVKEDRLEIVKYFLELNPNILHERGPFERTPLHTAAMYDRLRLVKFLIGENAKVNARDETGSTALIKAAGNGNLEIVKFLLENGANPTLATKPGQCSWAIDDDNETAIHCAIRYGHLNIVIYLCTMRPDLVKLKTLKGQTPLAIARKFKKDEIICYL